MPIAWTLLSTAVAKAVAKLWLGDVPVVGDVADSVVDVLATKVSDERRLRSLVRQLEHLGDRIVEELDPYFSAEFGGLDDGERTAALLAVIAGLERAPLDRGALLAADLDPAQLQAMFEKHISSQDLSPAGVSFLNALLRDLCVYVVACALDSPNVAAHIGAETLRREREFFASIEDAISSIPRQVTGALGLEDPRRFEIDYRRELIRRLDDLTLYGAPAVPQRLRRYPLSVAYLTLMAATTDGLGRPDRVDAVLGEHRRIVVCGEAGSGKTTLLQWLAVRTAEHSLPAGLAEWSGLIPVFVPLRRFAAEKELPAAGRLLEHSAGTLATSIPLGFATRILQSGRALVLLDGLDELPARFRGERVDSWLDSICAHFGDCTFVVTSRPSGLAQSSLGLHGFKTFTLQPMDSEDVTRFVDYWHRAVATRVEGDAERDRLLQLQSRLDRNLEESRSLRTLASNPLLCALICALNRDRSANVPKDRMVLYSTALEMLLTRRDLERGVTSSLLAEYDDIVEVLQYVAYWMLRNGKSSLTRTEFEERVRYRLVTTPRISTAADQLCDLLVQRSGVLREPAKDEVDFVHMTFAEFLAGRQVVEEDDFAFLAREARNVRWQGVAVFATGHAPKPQRDAFLRSLLFVQREHGEEIDQRGKELLALACLEVSPAVDQDIIAVIRKRVRSLVPPRSNIAARLLGKVGHAALAPLAAVAQNVDETAAVCTVAALATTEVEEALPILAKWATDSREGVREEVAKAWRSFDPREFAQVVLSVLARGPHEPPPLVVSARELSAGADLSWARRITYLAGGSKEVLEGVPLETLRELRLVGTHVESLDLRRAVNLQKLTIEECPRLDVIDGLETLPVCELVLKQLGAFGAKGRETAYPGTLRALKVEGLRGVRELRLRGLSLLERLEVRDCGSLSAIELSKPNSLRHVSLRNLLMSSLECLSGSGQLKHAEIQRGTVKDGSALRSAEGLRRLILRYCSGVAPIAWISNFAHLHELSLEGCRGITSLEALAGLHELVHIDLSYTQVDDLSALEQLPKLASVELTGCSTRLDLSPIAHVEDVAFPPYAA